MNRNECDSIRPNSDKINSVQRARYLGDLLNEKGNYLGSVYMRLDPFGSDTKLVRISFVFTRDLVDPVEIGSAVWHGIKWDYL